MGKPHGYIQIGVGSAAITFVPFILEKFIASGLHITFPTAKTCTLSAKTRLQPDRKSGPPFQPSIFYAPTLKGLVFEFQSQD